MLNIIVCVKVVMDPEAPVSTFKVDPEGQHVLPAQGVPPVLNPYDENCLEAALRIKDTQPSKITVISAGKNLPKPVVKKCLAVGADDLVVLEGRIIEKLYDGYIIIPKREVARFTIAQWSEMLESGTAWNYE